MESRRHIQETAITGNGIYEVKEAEDSESFEREVARLKQELESERDQRLRLLAEFDNYRRRIKQDSALLNEAGKRDVLLSLLEVMDDFDRALLHINETSDAVADGLRLIHQRFSEVLESNGVKAFESEGEAFDPTIHDAIAVIDGDGEQSGTVYSEDRRGYLMNGKLLRPARVTVLK
jgi:molecular chaperone GrpE